jgi:hypothetical protein
VEVLIVAKHLKSRQKSSKLGKSTQGTACFPPMLAQLLTEQGACAPCRAPAACAGATPSRRQTPEHKDTRSSNGLSMAQVAQHSACMHLWVFLMSSEELHTSCARF